MADVKIKDMKADRDVSDGAEWNQEAWTPLHTSGSSRQHIQIIDPNNPPPPPPGGGGSVSSHSVNNQFKQRLRC